MELFTVFVQKHIRNEINHFDHFSLLLICSFIVSTQYSQHSDIFAPDHDLNIFLLSSSDSVELSVFLLFGSSFGFSKAFENVKQRAKFQSHNGDTN